MNAYLLMAGSGGIGAALVLAGEGKLKEAQEAVRGFLHQLTHVRVLDPACGSGNFLYATDFHNGKVDVFDATFTRQTPSATSFAFTDPTLPAGYALRFEAYNLNGVHEFKRRTLYTISQGDGAIARLESYDERRDRRFVVKLRAKF